MNEWINNYFYFFRKINWLTHAALIPPWAGGHSMNESVWCGKEFRHTWQAVLKSKASTQPHDMAARNNPLPPAPTTTTASYSWLIDDRTYNHLSSSHWLAVCSHSCHHPVLLEQTRSTEIEKHRDVVIGSFFLFSLLPFPFLVACFCHCYCCVSSSYFPTSLSLLLLLLLSCCLLLYLYYTVW